MNFLVISFSNGLTFVDKNCKYLRVISLLMVFKRDHTMQTLKNSESTNIKDKFWLYGTIYDNTHDYVTCR